MDQQVERPERWVLPGFANFMQVSPNGHRQFISSVISHVPDFQVKGDAIILVPEDRLKEAKAETEKFKQYLAQRPTDRDVHQVHQQLAAMRAELRSTQDAVRSALSAFRSLLDAKMRPELHTMIHAAITDMGFIHVAAHAFNENGVCQRCMGLKGIVPAVGCIYPEPRGIT